MTAYDDDGRFTAYAWPGGYPVYHVCDDGDPWKLAEIAAISSFNDRAWAKENVEIDGEADYGITACFYNPPDDEPWLYVCQSCGHESTTEYDECPECESEDIEEVDNGTWSDANGAWLLCEVFPVDMEEERSSAPRYDSLADCFSKEDMNI